jgi:flagellar hook protein FlgE
LLAPASFTAGHNPLTVGTPAAPYVDASTPGTLQNNKLAAANTGATLLSGLAATDSLTANFAVGNTITVNSGTLTFVASGAAANSTTQINITDDIATLLHKIDLITGTAIPSTISGGAITLHSGTASDLTVDSAAPTGNPTAFAALGFSGAATANRTGGGSVGTGVVIGQDTSTFLDQSIAGGAVTTYDISGAPVNLQFRWGKVDSASLGAGHTDTWNMFYQVNPSATGLNVAWQNVNTNFTFSSSGQMTPAIASLTLANASVNGVSIGSPVIVFGSGGVTQFADANGNVQVNQIQQDGFPAGQLQSVGVSTNGRIVGNYSNGRNLDLAEITLANFNGTNFLKRADGGAFEATDESGQALFGKGGTIVGASLEGSNTDIADEFTKLIVTQQAYSANTKVITTSNTMVQDLLNVLR